MDRPGNVQRRTASVTLGVPLTQPRTEAPNEKNGRSRPPPAPFSDRSHSSALPRRPGLFGLLDRCPALPWAAERQGWFARLPVSSQDCKPNTRRYAGTGFLRQGAEEGEQCPAGRRWSRRPAIWCGNDGKRRWSWGSPDDAAEEACAGGSVRLVLTLQARRSTGTATRTRSSASMEASTPGSAERAAGDLQAGLLKVRSRLPPG